MKPTSFGQAWTSIRGNDGAERFVKDLTVSLTPPAR